MPIMAEYSKRKNSKLKNNLEHETTMQQIDRFIGGIATTIKGQESVV